MGGRRALGWRWECLMEREGRVRMGGRGRGEEV